MFEQEMSDDDNKNKEIYIVRTDIVTCSPTNRPRVFSCIRRRSIRDRSRKCVDRVKLFSYYYYIKST